MALQLSFTCPLPNGLHARPASALEEIARHFSSKIELRNSRNGQGANLKSVLAMVAADVQCGDECRIEIQGVDAQEARRALSEFLEQRFAHSDDALPKVETAAGELRLPHCLREAGAAIRRGTPLVPGIGQGRLVRIPNFSMPANLRLRGVDDVRAEEGRMEQALGALTHSLDERVARLTGGPEADVLKAHRAILRDPDFRQRLMAAIHDNDCTAAGALAEVETHFTALLMSTGSELLHERALDVQDICEQLLRHLYGIRGAAQTITLTCDSIVVADRLTPNGLLELDRRRLKGLVLRYTGGTSHTVILARSFGVPTLLDVADLAGAQLDGQEVALDAEIGILISGITEGVRRYYSMENRRLADSRERLRRFATSNGRTRDGLPVEIAANVSSAEEVANAMDAGAESIGLLRTELLFMDRDAAPDEEEQYQVYRSAVLAARGKPITIRTLDAGGDKMIPYLGLPLEENPFLGYRAVRTYPALEELFRSQIRALLRASAEGQLRILIPMISCTEEVVWVKRVVTEEKAKLSKAGVSFDPAVQLGAMIEVPAAVFLLDSLSREFDFFSIGSNDLLQYFAAAERSNPNVSSVYQPLSPAFLRLLRKIAVDLKKVGKRVTLCGEMGAQPACLPFLVGLSLDGISMSAPAIARIKAELGQLSAAACRRLIIDTQECSTREEVNNLRERYAARATPPLLEPDLIVVESQAISKAEAIKELCDRLYVTGRAPRPRDVEEAVWQREDVYSTGFGYGFAIPHCVSAAILANSLGVLRLAQPVDWGSADGRLVEVVILLVVRDSGEAGAHMKIFSRLARQLMHVEFRERILEERDSSGLERLLSSQILSETSPRQEQDNISGIDGTRGKIGSA